MEMIRREACDGLTVGELVTRFPGTRRLFEIRCREAAGHSVLDEIINVRMARAVDLLAHTEMRIEAIASFCGFNTELAFWKAFSKRTGVSPLDFRKSRR
jgi:LacI family transcriptional regulator